MALLEQERRFSNSDFRLFRDLVYQKTGISLVDGKRTLLRSRLQKRLAALGIDTYSDYFQFLKSNDPEGIELQEMINRVTTNKTHFFREKHHFDYLQTDVFQPILDRASQGKGEKRLRIWSAGCSSGEEPYSIAMTIHDTFSRLRGWDIRVLASDIDTNVLRKAQSGVYHSDSVGDLDPGTVKRFFISNRGKRSESVTVRPEIQEMVAFRQINFADESWPVHTKFDAIFCRNVLIYFDECTQDRLVRRFADYLLPNGRLFIGHSESLTRTSDVYRRAGPTVFRLSDRRVKTDTQPIENQRDTKAQIRTDSSSQSEPTLKRLIVGDVFASEKPTLVTTTLGSCIATCLYDPVTQIGGMNHFALPKARSSKRMRSSFGVNAMELLINQILKLGGARHRLQAKVFGAAHVTGNGTECTIGLDNEEFIRNFLATEKIPLEGSHLGGSSGMQVFFETSTGRARLKLLDQETVLKANEKSKSLKIPSSDITLF